MSESKIEEATWRYAEALGWYQQKITGRCSSPDRYFARSGISFFIEFKDEGKKPTELQFRTFHKIRTKGGIPVYIIDSVDKGIALFNLFE